MTLENIAFHFLEEAGEEARAVRELIQMRNVLNANIQGVDEKFLEKIYVIDGLFEEYQNCMDVLKKDEENKPIIDITSCDPKHIKARIVKGKMGLIVELADTFSWFCTILIKLEMIAEGLHLEEDLYDLEKCLEKIYGPKGTTLVCPRCKSYDCKCLFFPIPK